MCVKRDKLTMQVHKYIYVFKYSIKQKSAAKITAFKKKTVFGKERSRIFLGFHTE